MEHPRRVVTTAAIGVIMLGTAGVAVASIPSSDGVIHGCYGKPGLPVLSPPSGTLRVIDSPSQNCTANETALTWNQTGPAGPRGPAGISEAWWSGQVNMVDLAPGSTQSSPITAVDATPGEYLITATIHLYGFPLADLNTGFARCDVPGSQSATVTAGSATAPVLGRARVVTSGPFTVRCTSNFTSGPISVQVYAQSIKVDIVR